MYMFIQCNSLHMHKHACACVHVHLCTCKVCMQVTLNYVLLLYLKHCNDMYTTSAIENTSSATCNKKLYFSQLTYTVQTCAHRVFAMHT